MKSNGKISGQITGEQIMLWWWKRKLKSARDSTRSLAAERLGQSSDLRVVDVLEATLTDKSPSVRHSVAVALQKLSWCPKDGNQCAKLAVAMGQYDEALEQGSDALDALLAALESSCDSMGEEDDASFQAMEARISAATAIGKLGDPAALNPLVKSLNNAHGLGWGLRGFDERLQVAIVMALGKLKIADDNRRMILIRALVDEFNHLDDSSHAGCEPAVKALGEIGDVRALPPLIAQLREGTYVHKDMLAAHAIGQIGGAEAEGVLNETLREYSKHCYRQSEMETIARILEEVDSGVQSPADRALRAVALGDYEKAAAEGEVAVEPLVFRIPQRSSDGFAMDRTRKVVEAIKSIHSPRAVTHAVDLLLSTLKKETHNSLETIWALGKLGDVRAVDALVREADNRRGSFAETAVEALRDLGSEQAVGPLIEILENLVAVRK